MVERCDFRVIDYLSYWNVNWDEVDEAIEELELRQVSNEKLDDFTSRLVTAREMFTDSVANYYNYAVCHTSITNLYTEFLITVKSTDDTEVKYDEVKSQFRKMINEVAIARDNLMIAI